MKQKIILALLLSSFSTPVLATEAENSDNWSIGVSSGSTLVGQSDDQAYISGSVTRDIGDGYIQLSATKVDAGNVQGLLNAVPATTEQLSLSAGYGFGAISLDADISIGRRIFDKERIGSDGTPIIVDSDGRLFGVGAALTYDIVLGENGFLSPSLSLDYSSVDIGRAITLPTGRQATIEEREEGVGATLSLSYARLFGNDFVHSAGPYVAIVGSTNSTAFSPGNSVGGQRIAQLVAIRDIQGQGDVWGEVGGFASFGLGGGLRLNLTVVQSFAFIGPESTSLGAGLSLSF